MTDPFSMTGSAVDVVSLGITVFQGILQYYSSWKDCPEDVDNTCVMIKNIHDIFQSIVATLSTRAFDSETIAVVETSIESCRRGISSLQKCLDKFHKKGPTPKAGAQETFHAHIMRLLYPFKKYVLEKQQDIVAKLQSNMILAVQALQLDISVNPTITLNEDKTQVDAIRPYYEINERIFHWLAAPDQSSNHYVIREKSQEGTGKWLVQSTEFQRWQEQECSFVWLHGIPGSGKTVLCSTIIEYLKDTQFETTPLATFAYFYFDFGKEESGDQTPGKVLSSLVTQLLRQSNDFPASLWRQPWDCDYGQQHPHVYDLLVILKDLISEFGQCYIVIDGLDESLRPDKVMEVIQHIADWKCKNLHLLISSRRERDIEEMMTTLDIDEVCMEQTVVDSDIAIYIRQRLLDDIRLRTWDQSVRDEIELKLTEGALGR